MRTPEQENCYELHVIRDAYHANYAHGHFVKAVLEAFEVADEQNFEMMRPFIRQFIRKYELKCTCMAGTTFDPGWRRPIPEWVNAP